MRRISPILALICLPLPLSAQVEGLVSAQIITGGTTGDGRALAALALTLAPDWKTYWRSPGEGGLPPEFDWSAAQNLKSVEFFWPTPQVLQVGGMQNIGYQGQMILPFAATPIDASQPITLHTRAQMGLCKDICIPLALDLAATLATGAPDHPAIAAAMADQPLAGAAAGVQGCTFSARPIKDGVQVALTLTLPPLGAGEVLVAEHARADHWISPPEAQRTGGQLAAQFDIVPPSAQPFDLRGDDLRLTILADGRAVDIQGCAAP